MTRFKKVLAVVLALTLLGSMLVVYANPNDASDAAIRFTPDEEDGVTDPGGEEFPEDIDEPDLPGPGEELDPEDPEEPLETDNLASMGINFWDHQLDVIRAINGEVLFHSIRARNDDWDIGEADDIAEAVTEAEGRYSGDMSVAGMRVVNWTDPDGFNVNVEVSAFFVLVPNPSVADSNHATYGIPYIPGPVETLEGFTLNLVPHSIYSGNVDPNDNVDFNVVSIQAGDGGDIIAQSTDLFAGGANFEGRLDVASGDTHNGRAQAQLTWVFSHGQPTG